VSDYSVTVSVGVAVGDAAPPRPAALALRLGGEARRLPSVAEEVSGREDLRVAGPVATPEQDYERRPETGEAMIYEAMSRIMLRRLTRAA